LYSLITFWTFFFPEPVFFVAIVFSRVPAVNKLGTDKAPYTKWTLLGRTLFRDTRELQQGGSPGWRSPVETGPSGQGQGPLKKYNVLARDASNKMDDAVQKSRGVEYSVARTDARSGALGRADENQVSLMIWGCLQTPGIFK
jgi:hypothetical protein